MLAQFDPKFCFSRCMSHRSRAPYLLSHFVAKLQTRFPTSLFERRVLFFCAHSVLILAFFSGRSSRCPLALSPLFESCEQRSFARLLLCEQS
eukprot:4423340-Pleurochrysis_carterae.AAC.2